VKLKWGSELSSKQEGRKKGNFSPIKVRGGEEENIEKEH
jgi:hypothetical protein